MGRQEGKGYNSNLDKQFASSISLQGGNKVVILDEADYLNPQSIKQHLKFIEELLNQNCRFILTCNFKNRVINEIQDVVFMSLILIRKLWHNCVCNL